MTLPTKWLWILSGAMGMVLLVTGCSSSAQRHKWLTFFFDGVPDPNRASTTTSSEPQPKSSTNQVVMRMSATNETLLVVHAPYAERKCMECHASNFSQRLKGEISAICLGCHKKYQEKALFTHATFAEGQCTLCHLPHQSQEKFLLVKNSRDLCFDCHKPEEILRIEPCSQSSDKACTVCHNPHQENRRFLLRSSADQSSPVHTAAIDP